MHPDLTSQLVPPWSSFRAETQRHLVLIWTDLLQRQLPSARGQAHAPGEPSH